MPSLGKLPEDQWPAWWKERFSNMGRPVVRLLRTLYGHPDALGYGERHCDGHVVKCSVKRIEDWDSCFWHPDVKLFLVIYVDYFKLNGPESKLEPMWEKIREGLEIGRSKGNDLISGLPSSNKEKKESNYTKIGVI